MHTFLHKLYLTYSILFAALAVSSISHARTIDTGDWLYVPFGARDLVVFSEENIIYLDGANKARRLDAKKRKRRPSLGRFKKIEAGDDGKIRGLSLKGNLYFLQDDNWQSLELKTKVQNFSVASDTIFIVSGGKIEGLTFSGQKRRVNLYHDILNVRSIDHLTGNSFVLLRDDGQVFVVTSDERKILDTEVKNVLFVRKNIIAVRKISGAIIFHLLAEGEITKISLENSANIKAMSVSPDGRIWGAAKRRIHYSPFTIEDLFRKLQHRRYEQKIRFRKIDKTRALRVFTGDDGTFRVNETGNLELWLPERKKFVLFPGRVSELSVAGYGQLWGINALGRIFHFRSGRWQQRPGIATSISARSGVVLITGERGTVHRYNWKLKRFKKLKLKARTVAVQNQRVYWILKDRGKISRCNRQKCRNIQGYAEKISISQDGVVFIIDDSGNLLRFDGEYFRLVKTPARRVRDVAAGIGGLPWIIDEEFRVYAGFAKKGKNFVLAGKNPYIPKGKLETDNATQGVGSALLDGLVLKGSKLSETADAPEEGFIFRRQVKFRIIPNNEYFFDLSMGRDGRLWALIATGTDRVFQFREQSKIFEVYNSSNFPGRRQPFLGLPKTATLSSIISDREGRIWAVADASKTVHYQESRNGSFKSILIGNAGANIQDITLDLEGNVYVAAGSIFLKKPGDRRFNKIFEKGAPFLRLSSGPPGTLWAVNSAGQAFELIDGKLQKRARLHLQDVDISVTGVVYGTSPTQTSGSNEPGAGVVVASGNLLCRLEKWNIADKKTDIVVNFGKHAQYVAVSRDGTPWTTCAPSGDNNVYRGRN